MAASASAVDERHQATKDGRRIIHIGPWPVMIHRSNPYIQAGDRRTYVLHRSIVHARPANPIIHTYVSHVGWRNEQGDVRTSSENYDGGDGSDDRAINARQSLLQLRNSLLFRLCRSFVCTPRDFVIFGGRHTEFSWTYIRTCVIGSILYSTGTPTDRSTRRTQTNYQLSEEITSSHVSLVQIDRVISLSMEYCTTRE